VKQVLQQHNFLAAISECLKDSSLQVSQSAFALMGDAAKHCCEYLVPFMAELIPLCGKTLSANISANVSNNAAWALGEVCVKVPPQVMEPYLDLVVIPLTAVLARPHVQQLLAQNVCITLGRLGLTCSSKMGKPFALFVRTWCLVMRAVPYDDEKVTAFQGLCCLIEGNPQACMACVAELAGAISSMNPPPPKLASKLRDILDSYKQAHGSNWPSVYAPFPESVKSVLHSVYQLS